MLSATERSVCVLTTENGLILFYKSFDKLLSKLIKKNVRVKMKASIGVVNRSLVNELRHDYDIANTDVSTPLLFVCTDERRLLQIRLRPDSFNVGSGEDLGFFSESQTLCMFFASLYGFLYEWSAKIRRIRCWSFTSNDRFRHRLRSFCLINDGNPS